MTLSALILLVAILVLMLSIDLGVFHREPRAQTTGEALAWSLVWVGTSLVFNVFIYFAYDRHWLDLGHDLSGEQAAVQFLTAYVVEKSLSLDNVFVIAMIFSYFAIPLANQHRVLYWGVVGALVMRAILISSGLALVERVWWTSYLLGGILLATAAKMLIEQNDDLQPPKNGLIRLTQRLLPITAALHGAAFFVRVEGRLSATPLFLTLIVIEASDLLFAVDSLPAVIAVTADPFLALSSNAFAILGLRSLYFVIAPLIVRFRYLKLSLIFVLAFVGMKLVAAHSLPISAEASLVFILGILGVGVVASIMAGTTDTSSIPSPAEEELDRLVHTTIRGARRIVVGVIGSTVVLVGIAMLVLPGPGVIVILIGLAALSTEFVWATRWLARVRETVEKNNPLRQPSRKPGKGQLDSPSHPPDPAALHEFDGQGKGT